MRILFGGMHLVLVLVLGIFKAAFAIVGGGLK